MLDPDTLLTRHGLIQGLDILNPKRQRHILIQAPAGYGKSVFASQYLSHVDEDHIWYDMDERDRDLVFFTGRLNRILDAAFGAYEGAGFNDLITQGEVCQETLARAAGFMAEQIAPIYDRRLFMVFDDIHLVSGSPLSFLKYLVMHLPGTVNLVCLSRNPDGLEGLTQVLNPVSITRDHLSLDPEEIQSFLIHLYGLNPDPAQAKKIFTQTEGWIMGIVAQTLHLKRKGQTGDSPPLNPAGETGTRSAREFLKFYFRSEILDRLDNSVKENLYRISLVDRITPEITRILCRESRAFDRLDALAEKMMFTRKIKGQGIALHHLFRDFLRNEAATVLGRDKVRELKIRAADFYAGQKKVETALGLYGEACDFDAIQALLKDTGMQMLAENRITTLGRALAAVPDTVAATLSWVSFYLGILSLDSHPDRALPRIMNGLTLFEKEGDRLGETLSLSLLVNYYVTIDVHYKKGRPFFNRLEALCTEYETRLLPFYRIQTLIALSHGAALMGEDLDRALDYAERAMTLASDKGVANFKAMALVNQAFLRLFCCDYKGVYTAMEQLFPLQSSQGLTAYTRMVSLAGAVNLLQEDHDFFNYEFYKKQILDELEDDLVRYSLMAPLLTLLDMDLAIAKGDVEGLRELLSTARDNPLFSQSPHMACQIDHFDAFLAGMTGDADRTQALGSRAIQGRKNVGGRPYLLLGLTITGAGLALCKKFSEAESLLTRAEDLATAYGETYIRASALLHRAYVKLKTGRECTPDLAAGLRLMKKNHYAHVTALSPRVLTPLMGRALALGLEPEISRDLAEKRLGLWFKKESPGPLLSVRVLGGFSIRLDGKELFRLSDLTLKQQELLMMVFTAPGRNLRVEAVQTALWPESPPAKGRSSFDSMMGRFRKLMKEKFSPHRFEDFLGVKNGILSLTHCRIDLDDFLDLAESGNRFYYRNHFWQAANRFRAALTLFGSGLLPGMAPGEAACALNQYRIIPLVEESITNWCRIMEGPGTVYKEDMALVGNLLTTLELTPNLSARFARISPPA